MIVETEPVQSTCGSEEANDGDAVDDTGSGDPGSEDVEGGDAGDVDCTD